MNWMAVLIAALMCLICGMLGLTAGINLNSTSTVSYVWDWNTAGSWVSGVGALLAVLASLWMANRGERIQAEREKENLKIDVRVGGMFAHLHIVSLGHYPVTVKTVLIGRSTKNAISPVLNDSSGDQIIFPVRLGFREEIHASWRSDQAKQLVTIVNWLQPFTLNELTIEVITSMDVYVMPVDAKFIAWLQDAANRHDINLLSPH
ncbi:hypothetical protein [Pseudomonas sp. RIT357]|uniref:hypothetical protein n=1 Tax=Pseudomonas sp. RIT357 TaxID=1470593 RepID=UPI0004520F1F|nr:hypothetical protein [Pseudomonas sp. RIT357]EZP62698.1 hypothetical protein BW43_05153 [Pseudomonas sp. RIT357]